MFQLPDLTFLRPFKAAKQLLRIASTLSLAVTEMVLCQDDNAFSAARRCSNKGVITGEQWLSLLIVLPRPVGLGRESVTRTLILEGFRKLKFRERIAGS